MLRDYQQTVVNETRYALAKYRRVIIQCPTGAGKTITASEIARLAAIKGHKILIVSNRTEIFSQNGGAFERAGLAVEYISPKNRDIPTGKVCCAMAQTLQRRVVTSTWMAWLHSIDFVFIDEAHTCDADFLHDILREDCYVVGLTATPSRGGKQRQLGSMYKAMVVGVSTKELIDRGFLAPAVHYSLACPKLNDVDFNQGNGDYNGASLAKVFERKSLYVGLVDEWIRLASGRKTLVFCVSSTQAIGVTKEFESKGVKAKYLLSGNFDDDDVYSGSRADILDSFKSGDFDVLVNVGIAVAGLDIPSIDCVVLNYATVSISKYLQSIGRGSRIAPGKTDFLILDCGDNYRRHGQYDAVRQWSLWHYQGAGQGIMTYKLCNPDEKNIDGIFGCGQMVPSPCKICPACGRKFITQHDAFQLHLEKISETSESGSIEEFVAEKKLEGWNLSRIMVQVCLSNTGHERESFVRAYCALYPQKSVSDAGKYWFVFKQRVWEKVKLKKAIKNLSH